MVAHRAHNGVAELETCQPVGGCRSGQHLASDRTDEMRELAIEADGIPAFAQQVFLAMDTVVENEPALTPNDLGTSVRPQDPEMP
jgi:hypothetical protein